jgi:eukaryotic-like serine/threonine-protein kinase
VTSADGAALLEALADGADPLAMARELVAAVASRHAAGAVHGALGPGCFRIQAGRACLEADPADAGVAGDAGAIPYAAPEVLRGARPGRRADVHAAAAIAAAVLGGAFPAPDASAEGIRRALHGVRVVPAGVPAVVARELRRALEPRWWRRARSLGGLVEALEGAVMAARARPGEPGSAARPSTALARGLGAPSPPSKAGRGPTPPGSGRADGADGSAFAAPVAVAAPPRLRPFTLPRSRVARAALLAAAAVALATAVLGGPSLERAVQDRLSSGDLSGARALLDEAERDGRSGPRLQKLRGDVACARGAQGECLRRYRLALAADPDLRDDEVLRQNTRRLLERADGCGTRRAAAELAGELRDPELLPSLRASRRNAGFLGFLCGGDAVDRAIATTASPSAR